MNLKLKDTVWVHSSESAIEGYYHVIYLYQDLTRSEIRLERMTSKSEIKWEYFYGSFQLSIAEVDYKVESFGISHYDDGVTHLTLTIKN